MGLKQEECHRRTELEMDNSHRSGVKRDSIGVLEQTVQKRSCLTPKICLWPEYLCTVQLPRSWNLTDVQDIVLDTIGGRLLDYIQQEEGSWVLRRCVGFGFATHFTCSSFRTGRHIELSSISLSLTPYNV